MLIHWIWLATREHMNDADKLAVLSHFGNPEDIYFADSCAYAEVPNMTKHIADSLQDKDLHAAVDILRQCVDLGIHICTFNDGAYPAKMKNITDPPMVLYYVGHLPDLDGTPVIAAVGTRKASSYGMNVARRIGGQLANCGAIVVSGMAAGIDGAAASGALSAGGTVVGVLGCGVDVVYPVCNRGLFADVERHGCLMSEFVPGTEPHKWNFPRRNRILSGLSNGVLVIEAPEKSGALITARRAADQGRDVFVVPGNVDVPTCAGSNALMREGATPVRNGWDVVSEYVHLYPDKIRTDKSMIQPAGYMGEELAEPKVAQKVKTVEKSANLVEKEEKNIIDNRQSQPYYDNRDKFETLPENQQRIVQLLLSGEQQVDDVIAQSQMPAGEVLSQLTLMEIQGIVARKPGKRVALK